MRQTQNLFHEDNSSRQKFAANQPQKDFCNYYALPVEDKEAAAVIVVSKKNSDSAKYFDLVPPGSFFKAKSSEESAKTKKPFFAEANKNENSFFKTAADFTSTVKTFQVTTNNSEALLELLLFYFDQIVYLKEMAAKIRELDAAAADEDIAQVNLIAHACADISISSGMTAAMAPLQRLAQLKTKLQLTDAAFLISQVRKELRGFRIALKEHLEQLTKQVQLNNLAVRSSEMN